MCGRYCAEHSEFDKLPPLAGATALPLPWPPINARDDRGAARVSRCWALRQEHGQIGPQPLLALGVAAGMVPRIHWRHPADNAAAKPWQTKSLPSGAPAPSPLPAWRPEWLFMNGKARRGPGPSSPG